MTSLKMRTVTPEMFEVALKVNARFVRLRSIGMNSSNALYQDSALGSSSQKCSSWLSLGPWRPSVSVCCEKCAQARVLGLLWWLGWGVCMHIQKGVFQILCGCQEADQNENMARAHKFHFHVPLIAGQWLVDDTHDFEIKYNMGFIR